MYYKGCNGKSDDKIKAELERLKKIEEERKQDEQLVIGDFCNGQAFKGIATSIAMAWFMQVSGSFLITNYASLIFEKSGSVLDPHMASIILAVVQIIGGLVSTQVGDTFCRKTTLYVSLFFSAIGLFTLSVYLYLRDNFYDVSNFLWVPELSLSVTMFFSSAGVVALANICAIENFPPKVSLKIVVI